MPSCMNYISLDDRIEFCDREHTVTITLEEGERITISLLECIESNKDFSAITKHGYTYGTSTPTKKGDYLQFTDNCLWMQRVQAETAAPVISHHSWVTGSHGQAMSAARQAAVAQRRVEQREDRRHHTGFRPI